MSKIKINEVTLCLRKSDDETVEKFEKSFENNSIAYKDKLTEMGLTRVLHQPKSFRITPMLAYYGDP